MPDQTITLTLYEKPEENVIKIGYKANDTTDKEIRLTGDQAKDNTLMNTLFSDLLPKDWIDQYKTIKSQVEKVYDQTKNAERLQKTKRGTFSSDKMSVPDIISALSTDTFKVKRFNIYVIKILLKELTNKNYNKYINLDILPETSKKDFDIGINLDPVKSDILAMAEKATTYDDNNNLIDRVFKPEFVAKYSGNITTWGREVQASSNTGEIKFSPISRLSRGGNNSTQKTHKINNNKTAKKNK
jgi:hypothetical protein